MSVLEIPKWPRTFLLRHLDPPEGWTPSDWSFRYEELLKGETPLTTFASPGGVPRGRKASLVFSRIGEDVAVIGLHFLHRDGDAGVADFTDADQSTITDRLATLWLSIRDTFASDTHLDRTVWHRYGVGVRRPNPAVAEIPGTGDVAGTLDPGDQLPPQVACSVTLKTSGRRQWGRVYLPATVVGNVTVGRFAAGYIEAIRTAFGTLADGAAADGLPLVVWSPRHDGNPLSYGHAAHDAGLDEPDSSSFARTVDQIQVDDLTDVIRSRRFDKAALKETHTVS